MFANNRVRAFNGPMAEQKAERTGNWFKAGFGDEKALKFCLDNKIPRAKATAENSGTIGGFLAPDTLVQGIVNVRETQGSFRQHALVQKVNSVTNFKPRRVGGLTAQFTLEGQPIQESSLQFDGINLNMRKAAILVRASAEVLDEDAAELGETIASEMGYALQTLEDSCGFSGDGTSTYSGISGLGAKLLGTSSSIAAAAGHSSFQLLDSTDLGNLIGGVLASALPGARFFCSSLAYGSVFCRIAASTGGLTATTNADGSINANFLGYPIVFTGALPATSASLAGKPMIYFGNLAMSSVIATRHDRLVIALSRERAMDADQILVRATERLDIINHLGSPSANQVAGTSGATLAPCAVLIGTA